jgi:hypothetical protein
VLIFPDQHISQDQHLDFARHFGPLDASIGVHRKDTPLRVRQEITDDLDFKNEIWGKESRRRSFQLRLDMAYRQFVQTGAGAGLAALCALHRADRRARM